MKTALDARRHLFNGAGLGEARRAFNEEVPIGQQRQHQFMYQILLANDLLPQPVFQVRKELVIHGSSLCYCCVRNSVFSDHYKA